MSVKGIAPIKDVVAITPVWNEPLGIIQKFQNDVAEVRRRLNERGVSFRHFFLDDGAMNLQDESSILVRHSKNLGLATTLVDGYEAVLTKLKTKPDLVVRLDCQEHDALMIPTIVDHLDHTDVDALFIPVVYTIEHEPRRLMTRVTTMMADLQTALSPINGQKILEIYNQVFPVGYQAYRFELLTEITQQLRTGLSVYERTYGRLPTWGFDLLSILFTAKIDTERTDLLFGGWMTPWLENRGADKVEAQRKKNAEIIKLAVQLGCVLQQPVEAQN